MSRVLPLLLALGLASAAQAQSVAGTVRDAETRRPLAGATVYAPAFERGTTTDDGGAFRLALPVQAESVRLRVSFVGYRTDTVAVALPQAGPLDVALAPEAAALGTAEVVADRRDAVASTRMSTTTITAREVERLPALLGEPDPIKTVQLLPGVQSGSEGQTGLYVRGGGPDQNLVLLDGAPVYNVSHVLGFLSVFNGAAVDRVELTTGGFPARYGGRLSSVVDVSMRGGSREGYAAEGSVGVVASSLTAEGPLPGTGRRGTFLVSGRRTYIDALARPFLASRTDGREFTSYFYDANARLALDVGQGDWVTLTAYLGDDEYGTAYRETAPGGTTERFAGGAAWGNAVGSLRWRRTHSDRLSTTLALVASRYRFVTRTRLEQGASPGALDEFQEVAYSSGIADVGGRTDLRWAPAAGHDVRAGAALTRHGFSPGAGALRVQLADSAAVEAARQVAEALGSADQDYVTWEASAYVEDDVEIGRGLAANVGLHAAGMRVGGRTYASLQPRLSARLRLGPDLSVKGSFSAMEQYLHLLANTGINLPTDLWLAPTERVPPQRAWQAAFGAAARRGGLELSVEAFYKDMRNVVEYEPGASFAVPGEGWEDKVEVGRGWAYGAEALVRKGAGRTQGWVGYTLSWSRRRFDGLNDGRPFPYRYDRRHDVSVVLSHRFSDRLDLGATWVYGTGQAVTLATARFFENGLLDPRQLRRLDPSNPEGYVEPPTLVAYGPRGGYRMAPYHRLDVVLNWHFGGALFLRGGESTLSVGAYNAYSRRNPFFLFAAPGENGGRVYKQASLFPILPAVAYRFRFGP